MPEELPDAAVLDKETQRRWTDQWTTIHMFGDRASEKKLLSRTCKPAHTAKKLADMPNFRHTADRRAYQKHKSRLCFAEHP